MQKIILFLWSCSVTLSWENEANASTKRLSIFHQCLSHKKFGKCALWKEMLFLIFDDPQTRTRVLLPGEGGQIDGVAVDDQVPHAADVAVAQRGSPQTGRNGRVVDSRADSSHQERSLQIQLVSVAWFDPKWQQKQNETLRKKWQRKKKQQPSHAISSAAGGWWGKLYPASRSRWWIHRRWCGRICRCASGRFRAKCHRRCDALWL